MRLSAKIRIKNRTKSKEKIYGIFFSLWIVLSYTVVIQPAYDPPEDEIITRRRYGRTLLRIIPMFKKEGDKYYMIYKNDKDEISKEDAEEMKWSGFEVKENEEK